MKVVTLLLTAIIGGIFHKQCQRLAWRVKVTDSVCHKDTYGPGHETVADLFNIGIYRFILGRELGPSGVSPNQRSW